MLAGGANRIVYQAVFLQKCVVHQILKKEMRHAIKS
jgi:hypothetical protein